jgi:purine catabolism regulator
MSEQSGRGVLVQDKRLGLLAGYAPASLLAIWEDVLDQFSQKSYLPEAFADRKKAGKATLILRQELPDGLERVITPISVRGVARGYLSLIDVRGQLDILDQLITEQGALVCGIEMARAKAVREAEKKLKGDLLTALLQEDITPRDANLWVRRMGLDLDQAHVAIRFAWDHASPPSLRRLETLVNGEIAGRGLKVLVEALGMEILCICQVGTASSRPEVAINLANGVSAMAAQEYPEIPLRVGIGTPVSEITFWRDSFRQAGQALELARRLRSRSPNYFPDLSVYRLLLQLEHHPDLNAFREEILGSLLSYEGGGDFIKTLEVYFEHNGNLSQAAEALFIHRNTLTYRMERISEVTGLDLDHTETRLALQLALRIHHMLERGV